MINQTKIPPLEFMRTKDNCIKFKIGKLRFKSNEDFQYIYNVEIEISEKIVINFRDPKNLIETQFSQYDFSINHVNLNDYEFEYKGFRFLFEDLHIVKFSSDHTRKAKAGKIIIKKGKLDNGSEVNVWELIDKDSLQNGSFEYGNFKINICEITNKKIKENYNAKYCFNYKCKYDEIVEWNKFTWKLYLMLRFYTANLLLPQTKIIIDNSNNFEIIFNGFDSYGEGNSIFNEGFNCFTDFLKTSFEIFNENWEIYNLLFTYWINIHAKNFMEINNLSGFVLFEILVKKFSTTNKPEFSDKLYDSFELQDFDLKFINELFFKEYVDELREMSEKYLIKYNNAPIIYDIFEVYENYFIIFYLQFYRNEIVHQGMVNFKENDLPKILNKIHRKIDNEYLNKYKLNKKTVNNFKIYQNRKGTYWKGFRDGFKIGDEQKNRYEEEFNENIRPIIMDVHKTLTNHFKQNSVELMYPLEVFDRIIVIFLIKLLNINCILTNEPKFHINKEYLHDSKEYISKFLKKDDDLN